MCNVCGCGEVDELTIEGQDHSHEHSHEHSHDGHSHSHPHEHSHDGHSHSHSHDDGDTQHMGKGAAGVHVAGMSQKRLVQLEQNILGKNQEYADANRERFTGHLVLNLVSSPGAGKTTLLCKTLEALQQDSKNAQGLRCSLAVIEGDQQTANDAKRIRETGVPAIQINTGKGCHLDAHMVGHAAESLLPQMEQTPQSEAALLFIENVGNLVCPASFDLGEDLRVAILSVTEGEDKPIKYPDIFAGADLVLINKIDLLPFLQFDLQACEDYLQRVAPHAKVFKMSSQTGEGLDAWLSCLLQQAQNKQASKQNKSKAPA